MQTCVVAKHLRSFRDSVEEPLGISDGDTEAEEKVNENLAADQAKGGQATLSTSVVASFFCLFPANILSIWRSVKGTASF